MTTSAIDALHDIHTATNDILQGYREMGERAQPEIQAVIQRLTSLHAAHATEQTAELTRAGRSGQDDSSLQGTLNKVVVILRDWVSDLDRDALPAVRDGEESLRNEYHKALDTPAVAAHPSIAALLRRQREEINAEVARLPQR